MEQPYQGRATIQDDVTHVQITIPAKKNWFVIIFMCVWLCGWLMGEVSVLGMGIFGAGKNPASLFLLVWLVAWTFGGLFAMRGLLWNLRGKEIITVGQGILGIEKKGAPFFKAKEYDLNQVKNFRVQETNDYSGAFGRRYDSAGAFGQGGTLKFDYGLKTVRFGSGLDEAEARYIIQQLESRRLLTEKNR